jgi:hypothetical protein
MTLEDLINEERALRERINATINFEAGDPNRLGMGDDETFALKVQLQAMRQYLKAIDYRIEKWTKRNGL